MKWKQTAWDLETDEVFELTIVNGRITKMVKVEDKCADRRDYRKTIPQNT